MALISIAPGKSVDPAQVVGITTDAFDGDRVVIWIEPDYQMAIFINCASYEAAITLADSIRDDVNDALTP